MEISTIITIAVCAIVIIGFTVFVLQKSKPLKVKTEHGLDESAAELAEKMMGADATRGRLSRQRLRLQSHCRRRTLGSAGQRGWPNS